MGAEDAYERIKRRLIENDSTTLVKDVFFEEVFGNFTISFLRNGKPESIVCDRGEIYLCDDLDGNHCSMVLNPVYDANEEALMAALNL